MTDYSQDLPYIMGIPEMARAFKFTQKNIAGRNIDILVLDYLLYEQLWFRSFMNWQKKKKHCVKKYPYLH